LWSVSCPTASFCAAVDRFGGALTYNGTSWSPPDQIDPGHWLYSVSCATASFCVAVDFGGNFLTYNGTSWSSPVAVDAQYGLSSVSCATASFCVAVDGNGNFLTYNGTSWSSPDEIDPSAGSVVSVSCPTASFCAAVDDAGNIFTYNGSSWSSPDPNPGHDSLLSVSCSAVGFCAAVVGPYVFTYQAVVTLTQASPTSASVADGAGYSGQLTVTNATGSVTYTETSSTDSGDVVVGSTGAITAATSLTPGTYTVSGTDHDTNGDTGTWSFALTVRPPGWSPGMLIDPPRGDPISIGCGSPGGITS
jgi:uncharacterized Fe-S cluster protein YjdI